MILLGGCNFRCSYCHNPDIVHGRGEEISLEEVLSFLEKRRKYLDGVVISGGEPTLHDGLRALIVQIRELGYAIKLDTNGTRPEVVRMLIDDRLIDYIAMDIKAPINKYATVTAVPGREEEDVKAVMESIGLIIDSGVDHEFRTTICREQLTEDDIAPMAEMIRGAQKYCLQSFKNPGEVLDGQSVHTAYSEAEMAAFGAIAEKYVEQVVVR